MKFPIEWHENCLANAERTLHNYLCELASIQNQVDKLRIRNIIYKAQIERAKLENKLDFDREKFNKKRG